MTCSAHTFSSTFTIIISMWEAGVAVIAALQVYAKCPVFLGKKLYLTAYY